MKFLKFFIEIKIQNLDSLTIELDKYHVLLNLLIITLYIFYRIFLRKRTQLSTLCPSVFLPGKVLFSPPR